MRCATAAAAFVVGCCLSGGGAAQNCSFNGSSSGVTLPPLDPSLATTQSAFTDLKVKCTPALYPPTLQFSGANGSSPFRMKHATANAFIPYTLSVAFVNNTGVNQNWRLTVVVLGTDYVNAPAGAYSDLLTATVLP